MRNISMGFKKRLKELEVTQRVTGLNWSSEKAQTDGYSSGFETQILQILLPTMIS